MKNFRLTKNWQLATGNWQLATGNWQLAKIWDKKIIIILCILLKILYPGQKVYAQINCGFDDVTTSLPAMEFNSFCGSTSLIDYIPGSEDQVKEIDMVINVMQKESPANPDNFINTPAHIEAIKTMFFDHFIDHHNKFPIRFLEKNVADGVEIPNHPFIQDSKIQPRIVEINFIQDNQGHNNDNFPCGGYNFELYKGTGAKTDAAIMVYLVEDIILSDTSGPHLWSVGGCGHQDYIIMHGLFQSYMDHQENADSVYLPHIIDIRELMTHELGHTLGLYHTFGGGCGGQLDDVIPCPGYHEGCYPYVLDTTKPDCNNNIMSYATIQRYLSPKQIGTMHRTLTKSSSARFVRPHSNSPSSDIFIENNETWDVDRFVTGDIYIETGSTFTINCVVFMPPKARIIVKRGARLMVECGKITTNRHPFNSLQKYPEGDYWGGIEVWGNTAVAHDVTMRSPLYELQETDPGIVLLNNAEISNAKPGIATVQRGGYAWETKKTHFGGLVYANNGTRFLNNRKSLEFMAYPFFNMSSFEDCIFEDHPEKSSSVTIWGTHGISFTGCDFKGIEKHGILAYDADIMVKGCTFGEVHHAVENYSSYPMSSALIVGGSDIEDRNAFNSCKVGVYMDATGDAAIRNNTFEGSIEQVGVEIQGMSQAQIRNNIFTGLEAGIDYHQTLEFARNLAFCNNLANNKIGISYQGNNDASNFIYNNFTFRPNGLNSNVAVTYATDGEHVYPGSIREYQLNDISETEDVSAGNLFGSGPSTTKRHIVAREGINFTKLFKYYHSNVNVQHRVYPYCGIDDTLYCDEIYSLQNFTYKGLDSISHNSGFCSELPDFDVCDSIPCYVELKQDHLLADTIYNKDPSEENDRDRIIKMSRRFESLRMVINRLQTEKDYTSFLSLINDEDHDLGRKARMWYYIDQELWEDGRDYLDLFDIRDANDQAFVDAQEINLNRLEFGPEHVPSSIEIDRLWEIAHTVLPDRSFARGLLVYMLDTIFEPQFLHDSILNRQSKLKEVIAGDAEQKDFLVTPNPFTDQIVVSATSKDQLICGVTLYVSTLQGQKIFTKEIESQHTVLSLDDYSQGIYILTFVDCNNRHWSEKLVKI